MVRVALAQVNTVVGDLKANISIMKRYIDKAKSASADLVIFPELTITGYPPEDLLLKNAFITRNMKALEEIASGVGQETVCLGYVRPDDGFLCNSMAVLSKGKVVGHYDKMHLPNYSVFDEKRYFHQGAQPVILQMGKASFVLSICEDLWVQKGPVEKVCASLPVDGVINISSSPYFRSKIRTRTDLVSSKARNNKTHVFYCNLVGGQDELVFDGGSMVASPEGKIVAMAPQFQESLLLFDMPLNKKPSHKKYAFTRILTPSPKNISRNEIVPLLQGCELEIQEIHDALVTGVHDYVRKNGFSKVLIGLSGGIDSAVVAALAINALGRENVIGVTMPSRFSSKATYKDALQLAKNLGITTKIFPINNLFKQYLFSFKDEFKNHPFDATEENIQARIRGNILMALSNKYGWLVLTTGNKSEISVGYCTLYGDMAGGFSVIKDVYKTLVYQLADYINRNKELIPQSTIDRPPTAELRPGQKDQDSLPPYDLLDSILELYIEKDLSIEEITKRGFDKTMVAKVIRMVDLNEYKRRQAPLGIKITQKSFGKDRRMPIVNRFS